MPHFGDSQAPVQTRVQPSFVEKSEHDMHGLPNVVTGLLGSYRGYDTMGETAVIFTAGIAVILILRRDPKEKGSGNSQSRSSSKKKKGKS